MALHRPIVDQLPFLFRTILPQPGLLDLPLVGQGSSRFMCVLHSQTLHLPPLSWWQVLDQLGRHFGACDLCEAA